MMKNKRGVFLAIYLPLMTLFMCGLMIGIYMLQQKNIPNSLVSPRQVLELQDKINIYELWENQSIYDSINSAGKSSPNLDAQAKEAFCRSFVLLDSQIRSIIYNGQSPEVFCNNIYVFNLKAGSVERKSISSSFKLTADDRSKINFPVTVSYSFQKKYIINLDSLK